MASDRLNGALRHLLRNMRPLEGQDSDASLLELYLRHRNESAFESLLVRHGPLVLGVCRRVLANEQDAEDAFQATFLILIRKAASVKKQTSLGSWLYRVAYRTAQEARRSLAKRRAREVRVARPEESPPQDNDLREVLDKELSALPERYREAVILCDLEGKERKEAALELGCPEGTVASRLARGRLLLAKRLARHGLTAGALAAIRQQTSASVSAELVSSTMRAALSLAGAGAVGAIPVNVSSLMERVVRNMLVVKLRAVTAVVLLVVVVGTGAGWLYYHREAVAQASAAGGDAGRPGQGDKPAPPPGERRQAEQENGFAALLAEEEKSRPPLLKSEPIKVERQDDDMQRLLKERYNEALGELTLSYQAHWIGRGTLDHVYDAGRRLVKAGLELMRPEEQIVLLRQYVEVMKGVEKLIEKRFREARVGMVQVHEARYHRMEAEIELLRLKGKRK